MATINANKRRRTAADTLHISDLPIGFIVDVSSYLPKPSRAILAVAFSGPSSSWKINNDDLMHRPSPISTATIAAQQWDILDFEDIEKELANELTDDDISAVLKCINAKYTLKRLKLCGCINITGHGLYPLRSSVVLEQIDISLVGKYECPKIGHPKISVEAILPILQSIISSDGCSLKYVLFPQKWRPRSGVAGLESFLQEYNVQLITQELNCSKCSKSMDNITSEHDWTSNGYQNNMCYDCLQPFCDECMFTENTEWQLSFCKMCRKDYCLDCCVKVEDCEGCGETVCGSCIKENNNGERLCGDCNY